MRAHALGAREAGCRLLGVCMQVLAHVWEAMRVCMFVCLRVPWCALVCLGLRVSEREGQRVCNQEAVCARACTRARLRSGMYAGAFALCSTCIGFRQRV